MARLRNGFYNAPLPQNEQEARAYKRGLMQAKSDLRTECNKILQQSDIAHAESARDYHELWLQRD
ncbi:hypothetical protein A3K73_03895 [Candidatus Pacearchaeota archaeon RBG_13_36_9]|nr:MAG: hypothetical protein A3K73_03895 [Candidatus Pacearchaeota archaeon RBG_13_36_9]